jgi:prepilin-type processing-associated H-X9-DG protein
MTSSPARFTLVHLIAVVAITILVIAFLLPAIRKARDEANLAQCQDNLRQIGAKLISYARANNGSLPLSDTIENPQTQLLHALAADNLLSNPEVFYCPSIQNPALRPTHENFIAGRIGYFYYSATSCGPDQTLSNFLRNIVVFPRRLDTTMNPKTWIMSDIWNSAVPTAHPGFKKGVNYLMLDGSVDFLTESPRHSFR